MKLQYSGHLMQTDNLLVKSLMLGKIEGRRRGSEDAMADRAGKGVGKLGKSPPGEPQFACP